NNISVRGLAEEEYLTNTFAAAAAVVAEPHDASRSAKRATSTPASPVATEN
ncbi:hypothetical protein CORC01_01310, partial [Colletotrichum orchidophilum]